MRELVIMAIPFGKYTIKSYQGQYLSVDCRNLSKPCSGGSGKLLCAKDCRSEGQHFYIIPVAENTNIYTIQPVPCPGVYLRMDGSSVTTFAGPGGGIVNLQYGVTDEEKFKIVYNGEEGMFCFASLKYPFVFLRTDVSQNVVNCQYGAFKWEMYTIRSVCASTMNASSSWN